jgi:hypothetical protein
MLSLGLSEGRLLGRFEGSRLGEVDGTTLGINVGVFEGTEDGIEEVDGVSDALDGESSIPFMLVGLLLLLGLLLSLTLLTGYFRADTCHKARARSSECSNFFMVTIVD